MPRRRAESAGTRQPGRRRARPQSNPASHGRAARRRRPPAAPGPVFRVKRLEVPGDRHRARRAAGPGPARTPATSPGRSAPGTGSPGSHVPATFAAAAPHQVARGRPRAAGCCCAPVTCARPATRAGSPTWCCSSVDASGSMAARARMGAVKGAVLSLLLDAYQRRDKVGMVTFRGSGAELALPPTFSVEAAAARLAALPTGGRTPLAAGPAPGRGLASRRAHPRPAPPPAAGPGHRRPRHRRPGPGGQRAPGGGPAGGGGGAQRGRRLRVRPGPARPGRPRWPCPSAAPCSACEHLAAGTTGRVGASHSREVACHAAGETSRRSRTTG